MPLDANTPFPRSDAMTGPSEESEAKMPDQWRTRALAGAAPTYTDEQKALWDLMGDLISKHPAQDVLDALSDAFIHSDPAYDIDDKRAVFIGRELERLSAEYAAPSRAEGVVEVAP